jgi:hypothetical protein
MANLSKQQQHILELIRDKEHSFPKYHRPSIDLEVRGYVRRSSPDETGDCTVKITPKGLRAISREIHPPQ